MPIPSWGCLCLPLALVCLALAPTKTLAQDVRAIPFDFYGPAYAPFASLEFGTPGQTISCIFDVGSSDTLLIDANNSSGPYYFDRFNPTNLSRDAYGELCRVQLDSATAFNSSRSSSFTYNISDTDLTSSFVWNQYEEVQGLWAHDRMNVANISQQVVAGILQNPNTTSCVIGLGPSNGEVAGKTYEERVVYPQYENFLDLMALGGSSSYTYSMWISKANHTGAVVFGGSDRIKYVGNLTLVPIVSYVSSGNQVSHIPGTVLTIRIMFHGLSVFHDPRVVWWNSSETSTLTPSRSVAPTAGLPDAAPSAATNNASQFEYMWKPALEMSTSVTVDLSTLEVFSRLPQEMVQQAADLLGLTWVDELGLYMGSCHSTGMVRLNVSGMYLQMTVADLMVPAETLNITKWKMSDDSDVCIFTLIPESSYSYIFGSGILRNVYTFFDLNLFTVGFAPLNNSMNSHDSQLVPYKYRDRFSSMNQAPAYSETMLSRDIAATFYATSVVANGNSTVVKNAAPRPAASLFIYLMCFL